jgi:hypothetical protein
MFDTRGATHTVGSQAMISKVKSCVQDLAGWAIPVAVERSSTVP